LTVHVFVGPTLPANEVRRLIRDAVIHPPIQHGDLLRLSPSPGEVVVIIDGFYHQTGSVRHKEILHVLAGETAVVGSSSMGALRAAELHPYGMVGNGKVFDLYRDGVLDADDEVAVVHGDPPDYRAFSLPLVNVRHGVQAACLEGAISPNQAERIVEVTRGLPYQERTWRAVSALTDGVDAVRRYLTAHPEHADLKAADAIDTLSRLGELGVPRPCQWAEESRWRTRFLDNWIAAFRGGEVEGVHVGDAAAVRYQRIYRPEAATLWRDHVLGRIAGRPLATAALAASAEAGITPARLTSEQRATWLTEDECGRLSPEDALLTVLVRSHQSLGGELELVAAFSGALDPEIRREVAECYAINAEVSTWAPTYRVDQLKYATLRDHLASIWGTDHDDELLAAGRDRGFRSLHEAVDAVRPFYLRTHFTEVSP
jgi:hypothetical protein